MEVRDENLPFLDLVNVDNDVIGRFRQLDSQLLEEDSLPEKFDEGGIKVDEELSSFRMFYQHRRLQSCRVKQYWVTQQLHRLHTSKTGCTYKF